MVEFWLKLVLENTLIIAQIPKKSKHSKGLEGR